VVHVHETEFVLADIPGLIEGAHEGAGLGTRFLGHVERCAVLIHLVDGTQEDVAGAYRTIRAELAAYGHGLAEKPEIVALNKVDALTTEDAEARAAALAEAAGIDTVMRISGVSGAGMETLLSVVHGHVMAARAARAEAQTAAAEPVGYVP
jgi:GTP-binding protein